MCKVLQPDPVPGGGGNSKLSRSKMSAKEYLYQLWNLDREIEIKYRELEKLKAQVGIRAMPDPGKGSGGSGGTSDPVSSIAVKIVEMEGQLDRKIDRLINLKEKIGRQIDGMENRTYRNILICRYILMQNWDQVAESCGYERTYTIKRLYPKALQAFQAKYLKSH